MSNFKQFKPKAVNAKSKSASSSKKTKLRKNKGDSDSDEEEVSEYETTSDSTYEPPKHKPRTRSNSVLDEEDIEDTEDEEEDEDDDEDEDDEDDEDDDEDEDDGKDANVNISRSAIQKIISQIFPSKYMSNRAKQSEEAIQNKKSKKTKKAVPEKKRRRQVVELDEDDEEDEDDEDEDEDELEYEDDEEEDEGLYNILLLDGMDGQPAEDDYNEEDDDAECDSDDEKMFMREAYETVDIPVVNDKKAKKAKKAKKQKAAEKSKKEAEDEVELTDVQQEYLDLVDTKKTLTTQLQRKPTNKILQRAVRECDASIKDLIKQSRINNAKAYHKLIHSHKKQTNEVDYFKKKLSNKEQLQVMNDLKEINSYTNINKPYRLALLDAKMPAKFKSVAMQKLSVLRSMDPSDNEYYKIKNWVDAFMKIPFGVYRGLTVSMDDGVDKCHEYMNDAMTTLNNCVYGLNDAKLQIMQMVGQWISNPSAMGTAIAIKGPMGTGKTTLVKDGISKILGRDFAFIALGGTGDSSFLEGHSYTYEGSTWGKIAQILMNSKCMNPVIYFDELDKISDTPRGEEIVGILTHLTDTSQNSQFHDKYFSEVDFDLSKCLFIFSYNDESKVNPILRDRMYRIQTKGYDAKEKVTIARNYLLPKIQEQVNFKDGDVIIPDETLQYIISNVGLTSEEAGVRNLKRCLEIIYTKLNLFRLMKPDTKIIGIDIDLKVSFPFTVTKREVDIIIKSEEKQNQSMLSMYV
jgi:ATP-dependent Lon protease